MDFLERLEQVRQRLEARIVAAVTAIMLSTRTSSSSTFGDGDSVETSDNGGAQKSQRPVSRVMPFGLASRPPAGLRGISLRFGASNVLFMGILPTQAYLPQSLNVGESVLYAKPGQTVLCDQDGNIVETPAGSGTVQLGGNNFKLPKWDDGNPTGAGFVVALNTFIAALKAAVSIANVAAAATTFQATMTAASNFSSAKAQNG